MKINKRFAILDMASNVKRIIPFILSDETIDRHGTSVSVDWDLGDYSKNPVVLYNHQPDQPVGWGRNLRIEAGQLAGDVEFLPEGVSELADSLYELYKIQAMRGISVGFYSQDPDLSGPVPVLRKNVLVELSLCTIPSNPNALSRSFSPVELSKISELLGVSEQFESIVGSIRALKDSNDALKLRVAEFELAECERVESAKRAEAERVEAERLATIESLEKRGIVKPETRAWLLSQSAECVRSYASSHATASLKLAPTKEPTEASSMDEMFEGRSLEEITRLPSGDYLSALKRAYAQDSKLGDRIISLKNGVK
jgi:hypothetical protein